MTTRGKFIVIDGGEGSGKGSIVKHLRNMFSSEDVIFTREPGGTPLGEKIRSLIMDNPMSRMTELLLFEASRAEHMENLIAPALDRGTNVISDRFDISTYGYQIIARWNGKYEDLFSVVNSAVVGKDVPDLYLFCDVLPQIALRRRMATGEVDRFDLEELAFHEAVYRGQRAFLLDKRHTLIDASLPIKDVVASAERVVREELGF